MARGAIKNMMGMHDWVSLWQGHFQYKYDVSTLLDIIIHTDAVR